MYVFINDTSDSDISYANEEWYVWTWHYKTINGELSKKTTISILYISFWTLPPWMEWKNRHEKYTKKRDLFFKQLKLLYTIGSNEWMENSKGNMSSDSKFNLFFRKQHTTMKRIRNVVISRVFCCQFKIMTVFSEKVPRIVNYAFK